MTRNTVPHSWSIRSWPADVYPHESGRARYLLRANNDDLTRAGALARVGRELVIIGDRYARWLERRTAAVAGFECAANRQKTKAAQ